MWVGNYIHYQISSFFVAYSSTTLVSLSLYWPKGEDLNYTELVSDTLVHNDSSINFFSMNENSAHVLVPY